MKEIAIPKPFYKFIMLISYIHSSFPLMFVFGPYKLVLYLDNMSSY
jgi:hypothetical protein